MPVDKTLEEESRDVPDQVYLDNIKKAHAHLIQAIMAAKQAGLETLVVDDETLAAARRRVHGVPTIVNQHIAVRREIR